MRDYELMIYRIFPEGRDGLLHRMARLITEYEEAVVGHCGDTLSVTEQDRAGEFYECIHSLLEQAADYGFHGNLWHCYLAHLLVTSENGYSRGCEMRGAIEGTVNEAVLHDIAIFKEFFDYDFAPLCEALHVKEFRMVEHLSLIHI